MPKAESRSYHFQLCNFEHWFQHIKKKNTRIWTDIRELYKGWIGWSIQSPKHYVWCTVRENEWQLSLRRLKIVKRLLDFAVGLMMNIKSSSVDTWGGGLAVGEWELEKVTPQSVKTTCSWNSAVHPVIKTPSFHYRGHGFDPWLQKWHFTTEIQYASRCGQKTKQQETTWSVAKYIGLRKVRWGSFNEWYRLRWAFFF